MITGRQRHCAGGCDAENSILCPMRQKGQALMPRPLEGRSCPLCRVETIPGAVGAFARGTRRPREPSATRTACPLTVLCSTDTTHSLLDKDLGSVRAFSVASPSAISTTCCPTLSHAVCTCFPAGRRHQACFPPQCRGLQLHSCELLLHQA